MGIYLCYDQVSGELTETSFSTPTIFQTTQFRFRYRKTIPVSVATGSIDSLSSFFSFFANFLLFVRMNKNWNSLDQSTSLEVQASTDGASVWSLPPKNRIYLDQACRDVRQNRERGWGNRKEGERGGWGIVIVESFR